MNLLSKISNLFSNNDRNIYFNSSVMLGQKGAVYLDTHKPKLLYDSIPQLNQVIRKKSSMFANMQIKQYDKNGNEVVNDELYRLLENPNVLQNQNEFLKQYLEQKDVYGNQFMYKSIASVMQSVPSALWNISPTHINPVLTGRIYDQTEINGIVEKYTILSIEGRNSFAPEDIYWSKICDIDSPVVGVSPVLSINLPISNTKLAYDYLNIISGEKGAIGALTNKTKDTMGSIPMTAEEKKKIESAYQGNYGIGNSQQRIIITDAELDWKPMTYPTKDLLLLDQIDANFMTIIDHFGMNANLFSTKTQTFENVKNSIIQVYQDTIIVEAEQFCQSLSKFLKIPDGLVLKPDYSHLSILSNNQTNDVSNFKQKVESLNQLITTGELNSAQVSEILKTDYTKITS
jgi:HK97 family phage portal protein